MQMDGAISGEQDQSFGLAARVRVLVAHAPGSRSPVPALVYNAEVQHDAHPHRGTLWLCSHNHQTPDDAHQCGQQWLERIRQAVLELRARP